MASMGYTLINYGLHGKDMVLWNIVFPSGNRHSKREKRCSIKGKMSIKTSFMHYRNYITWTRGKLPVFFEEFDVVYIFWLLFSFHYYYQLVKGQPLAKNWRGGGWGGWSPPPLRFLRVCLLRCWVGLRQIYKCWYGGWN